MPPNPPGPQEGRDSPRTESPPDPTSHSERKTNRGIPRKQNPT
uniref:Uncharacterized protein n=1 Tax=Arundo donax TaxID=35708 RepID=A0A0A8Y6P0_ARUDO